MEEKPPQPPLFIIPKTEIGPKEKKRIRYLLSLWTHDITIDANNDAIGFMVASEATLTDFVEKGIVGTESFEQRPNFRQIEFFLSKNFYWAMKSCQQQIENIDYLRQLDSPLIASRLLTNTRERANQLSGIKIILETLLGPREAGLELRQAALDIFVLNDLPEKEKRMEKNEKRREDIERIFNNHDINKKRLDYAVARARNAGGFILAVHKSALKRYRCTPVENVLFSYTLQTDNGLPIKFLCGLESLGLRERKYLQKLGKLAGVDK